MSTRRGYKLGRSRRESGDASSRPRSYLVRTDISKWVVLFDGNY